jgi:subtilisin family serine protease
MKFKSGKAKNSLTKLSILFVLLYSVLPSSIVASQTTSSVDKKQLSNDQIANYLEKNKSTDVIVKYKVDSETEKLKKNFTISDNKQAKKLKVKKVKLSKSKKLRDQLAILSNDSNIEFIEPDYTLKADYVPNDANYNLQWGLTAMNATSAWDVTTGIASVPIAILDTGVLASHQDLAPNMLPGYNTIAESTNTTDIHGHGTHVAGIAAASINNGYGIAGLAGSSKIIPVKVLGDTGSGSTLDIAEGVIWAADHGAKVINMSLGSSSDSLTLQNAINYAFNKGVVVVAAAGNDNTSALHYPAANENVIAVSSIDQYKNKSSFSNYGSHIDVAAPGSAIYSTVRTSTTSYGYMQGTSMASPYVAGLAALLLSNNPSLTPSQVEDQMEKSATDLGTVGFDNYFGHGLINAQAALNAELDTTSPVLEVSSVVPSVLNTALIKSVKITYSISESSFVKTRILDSNGNQIKVIDNNIGKKAGINYAIWDCKNTAGYLVGEGVYTVEIVVKDGAGNLSNTVTQTIKVDKTSAVISSLAVSQATFKPTELNNQIITFTTNEISYVTVGIYNAKNALVNQIELNSLRSAGSQSLSWDGKDRYGNIVPDGNYSVKIDAKDLANNKSIQQLKTFSISRLNSYISIFKDGPDPFKATGSSFNTIYYTLLQPATVELSVLDLNGNLIKTIVNAPSTTGSKYARWDGKNSSGLLVDEGTYIYSLKLYGANAALISDIRGAVNVDKVAPQVTNESVSPGTVSSNTDISIDYTLSEKAKITVSIYNTSNVLIKTLTSNLIQQAGNNSLKWDGKNSRGLFAPDETYKIKITATDFVGFVTSKEIGTVVLEKDSPGITTVTMAPNPFKVTGTTLSALRYTLIEKTNVTIKILDSNNTVVRTLVDNILQLGIKTVTWNGKDDNGLLVPDGVYTYKIDGVDLAGKTATFTGTIKTDKTMPVISSTNVSPSTLTTDTNVTIGYNLSENAKVTLRIYNSSNTLVKTLLANAPQTSGTNTVTWDGKISTTVYAPDNTYTVKATVVDPVGFTLNQDIGTFVIEKLSPSATKITMLPNPMKITTTGLSTLRYILSEKANVTVQILNSSNVVVRTLVSNTLQYGSVSVPWNGKKDDGTLVDDGVYTAKIDIIDLAGKTASYSTQVVTDKTAPVISSLLVNPNPFVLNALGDKAAINFSLSENAKVTVQVYTSTNSLVRTLTSSLAMNAGSNQVYWYGTNSRNYVMNSGTYKVKVTVVDKVGFTAISYYTFTFTRNI